LDVRARRHGELHEAHLLPKRRLTLEEALEREEAPRNALRVIEPIDPEENALIAPFALERRGLLAHVVGLRERLELRGVDADRIHTEAYVAPVVRDTIHVRLHAQNAQERRRQVTQIRKRVKPDQVAAEEPLEDLDAPRERAEHLRRRKRNV